jgi:hypothetical protein
MPTTRTTRTVSRHSGLLSAGHYADEYDYHVLHDGRYLGRLRHHHSLGHNEWYALRGHGYKAIKFASKTAALRWLRSKA